MKKKINKMYSLQMWFEPYSYREVYPDLTDDEARYVTVTLEKIKLALLDQITSKQIKL